MALSYRMRENVGMDFSTVAFSLAFEYIMVCLEDLSVLELQQEKILDITLELAPSSDLHILSLQLLDGVHIDLCNNLEIYLREKNKFKIIVLLKVGLAIFPYCSITKYYIK